MTYRWITLRLAVWIGGLAIAVPAHAAEPDPVLQALVRETLDRSPDLKRAQLTVASLRERAPQAATLADPTLAVAYQNDGWAIEGFDNPMMSTFFSIMATQPLPWPGKRQARQQVVAVDVEAAEALLGRIRLDLEAQIRRGYVGLLLAREQRRLVDDQDTLWQQAEAVAKARNAVGQGSQLDLLRAQLERARLAQTKASLLADERTRRTELNRLAGRPFDAVLEPKVALEELPLPDAPADALDQTLGRSPELAAAKVAIRKAGLQGDLAQTEKRPDLAVTAGVMPRGFANEPMWQVGLSVTLPVWSGARLDRVATEAQLQAQAGEQAVRELTEVLGQRTRERLDLAQSTREINDLYRKGVLPRSHATVRSALAQYGVGKAPFVSVLEALNGWFADRSAFLGSLAQAHALSIALDQASLDAAPGIPVGAVGGAGSMGGGAGSASAARTSTSSGATTAAASAPGGGMGGM